MAHSTHPPLYTRERERDFTSIDFFFFIEKAQYRQPSRWRALATRPIASPAKKKKTISMSPLRQAHHTVIGDCVPGRWRWRRRRPRCQRSCRRPSPAPARCSPNRSVARRTSYRTDRQIQGQERRCFGVHVYLLNLVRRDVAAERARLLPRQRNLARAHERTH